MNNTGNHKIEIKLIILCNEHTIRVPPEWTVDILTSRIVSHFKLHNDSWRLVLHSENGYIDLDLNKYLVDYLIDAKNPYLKLLPLMAAG